MLENETLIKIGFFWNVDLTGKRGCTFAVEDGLTTFQRFSDISAKRHIHERNLCEVTEVTYK
jgi:hypothetical protein